jgi:hypothetical protein
LEALCDYKRWELFTMCAENLLPDQPMPESWLKNEVLRVAVRLREKEYWRAYMLGSSSASLQNSRNMRLMSAEKKSSKSEMLGSCLPLYKTNHYLLDVLRNHLAIAYMLPRALRV